MAEGVSEEEWRGVVAAPGYEVSNLGRVRRSTAGRATFAGRLLSPIRMACGYFAARPVVGGKNTQQYVHRMVAAAFIGPCPSGMEVNHIDGVKTNNAVTNLEYVTHAENMCHASGAGLMPSGARHPQARLSEDDVRGIRSARASGESFGSISRRMGVSISHVFNISNSKSRRDVA